MKARFSTEDSYAYFVGVDWSFPVRLPAISRTLTGTHGKFVAEPFERGFGVTVGNSLRRIMLSSLEGAAVTQIKLHGALHEFTTLPGVVEDVTDIVLNVKSLVFKSASEQPRVVRIDKSVRGVVTGADVLPDDQIDVINRDHVIATLTEDVPFALEMVVEKGRGYVPATENQAPVQEIGVIRCDAAFSPVTRVRYEVEETRVGQKDELRPADAGNLDQWFDHPGDGIGRVGQDPPQAPEPVRAVRRVGAPGAQRGPDGRSPPARSIRRPRPSWA